MQTLKLHHTSLQFYDLFTAHGLQRLDQEFLHTLEKADAALYHHLQHYRESTSTLSTIQTSEFLIELAKHSENFIAQLFNIEPQTQATQKITLQKNPIGEFRKEFLLTKVKRLLHGTHELPSFAHLHHHLLSALNHHNIQIGDLECEIATLGLLYLKNAEHYKTELEQLAQWCAQAILTNEGKSITQHWESFHFSEKIDHAHLVPTEIVMRDNIAHHQLPKTQWRERDGFNLTDNRMSAQAVQNEIHYCIYCHDHEGDLCSKGFPVNKKDKTQGFRKNPLDVTLTGCPLEERISEMHVLKRDGFTIGALAMVMLDNPMCPATGHRICNDCMKSCIYQKQAPVNIPQIETRVLTDVLTLPWGVEIYDLLTKWNPLRQQQWVMQPYNHKKVMIAGMGPAGFTLAHHLLQEGCAVVGFDGLKIESLPEEYLTQPIYDYASITENLDDRMIAGFGGVAEYGITVRWDKNFLKLIYITLMRRPHFQVFGNMRFGGTITIEDAWHLGFDHFVIAVGAGLPKALPVKNSMAIGMRQANDFLMALQLTGAAKKESFSALEIRLPALVIGGGLTGVDTATEAQAYYIRQIEKIAARYAVLKNTMSDDEILSHFDMASKNILHEFLRHAEAIAQERALAKQERREPYFIPLIHSWGGVSIVYRKTMQASPAYINNHEELHKALEEGIFYVENLSPTQANLDEHGHCASMTFENALNESVTLPAKSILVATGASLNVAYAFEHQHTFERKGMQYLMYDEKNGELSAAHSAEHCKDPHFGPFTSYHGHDHRRVTFIGDTHPVFHGNVVKAIASAKYTYPKIMDHLFLREKRIHSSPTPATEDSSPASGTHHTKGPLLVGVRLSSASAYAEFHDNIYQMFSTKIVDVRYPSADIIEIEIYAPQAVKHYKAGQFFRIQMYERQKNDTQQRQGETRVAGEQTAFSRDVRTMEGKELEHMDVCSREMQSVSQRVKSATTSYHFTNKVDHATHTLTFTFTKTEAKQYGFDKLNINDNIALMGPTGVRSKVSEFHETVLIIGNEKSLAHVNSYIAALKEKNNRVVFLGYFTKTIQNHLLETITKTCDKTIFAEDCITALKNYAEDKHADIPLTEIDRIQVIGESALLKEIVQCQKHYLKDKLPKSPKTTASAYGPMQCMLKGVCAQCLQWQIDPETGQRTKAVFACSWQDQPLEMIDLDHLAMREKQNACQETLNGLYSKIASEQENASQR